MSFLDERFCPHCRRVTKVRGLVPQYCTWCGHEFGKEETQRVIVHCPKCKFSTLPGLDLLGPCCPNCGAKLESVELQAEETQNEP